MTSKNNKIITLAGQEAMALWESGHDKWNQWVAENPEAYIDFRFCDFSRFERVSFSYFVFPTGIVNFAGAKFGDGSVTFSHCKFGDGEVNFRLAEFGNGSINFSRAIFGNGNVYFTKTKFGRGYLDFDSTDFGNGKVLFIGAEFGNGRVSFHKTKFEEVDFAEANFTDGKVDFLGAEFNGDASFVRTIFSHGNVSFTGAKSQGNMYFNATDFGQGYVSFRAIKSAGYVTFISLENTEKIEEFDFSFSSFDGAIKLYNIKFNCVPDFTNTKLSHQLGLDHFEINPKKRVVGNLLTDLFGSLFLLLEGERRKGIAFKKAKKLASKFSWFNRYIISDRDDIPRIRRLKELAESNKHHKLALDLHVEEIKSSRWIETTSKRTIFAEYLFQLFSDFGRSLQRPIVGLISTWLLFTPIYYQASDKCYEWQDKLSDATVFSFTQMLPVLQISKDAKKQTLASLYDTDMPNWIIAVAGVQSFISIALVFLVGLALRNRFRI